MLVIVTAPGPSVTPVVRNFRNTSGIISYEYVAFDLAYTSGVFAAASE